MDRRQQQTNLHTDNTRGSVSIHGNVSRSWFKSTNDYPKNDRNNKRNGHYKYLPAVILSASSFLTPGQALSETIGGVSATASPVANSSGSVTNQAIQVLQGPYITNQYGGGISCQGPTMNFTPYVTGSVSAQKPYEPYYLDPVYDVADTDDDGRIDNPGDVLFFKNTRTGQKDSYNLGIGFSATWSRPLDKKLQEQCKEAVATQISLQQQLTANKRLDFEIARLKNCGQLLQQGIQFKPGTKYAAICADVVVMNKNAIAPHVHSIPSVSKQTSTSESPQSSRAEDLGAPLSTGRESSSP